MSGRSLNFLNLLTPKKRDLRGYPFEVVAFLAEEPSPFGISTIGSRAMIGNLGQETLNSLTDMTGRTLDQAIRYMGGDPDNINLARRSPEGLLAFLELHIEQGP